MFLKNSGKAVASSRTWSRECCRCIAPISLDRRVGLGDEGFSVQGKLLVQKEIGFFFRRRIVFRSAMRKEADMFVSAADTRKSTDGCFFFSSRILAEIRTAIAKPENAKIISRAICVKF